MITEIQAISLVIAVCVIGGTLILLLNTGDRFRNWWN